MHGSSRVVLQVGACTVFAYGEVTFIGSYSSALYVQFSDSLNVHLHCSVAVQCFCTVLILVSNPMWTPSKSSDSKAARDFEIGDGRPRLLARTLLLITHFQSSIHQLNKSWLTSPTFPARFVS